jgi:hypothetical protein
MKSGSRRVFRYSSTYEKEIPDGPIRPRMELRRAPPARPQGIRTAQDPHSSGDPQNAIFFYVLKSGRQWRLLPHDFPKWPPFTTTSGNGASTARGSVSIEPSENA